MSTTSSIGTYDGLFDDHEGTLSGMSSFDVHQKTVLGNSPPWCQSTSYSSCCSLCRPRSLQKDPMAVNILGDHSFVVSCPSTKDEGGPRTNTDTLRDSDESESISSNSIMSHFDCESHGDQFKVTIQSISIPRRFDGIAKECYKSASILPLDALHHVFRYLDVASLCRVRSCSVALCDAVSNDNTGWAERCKCLWSQKVNVCSTARDLLIKSNMKNNSSSCTAMEAYTLSIYDAANRNEISIEDLCFDEATRDRDAVVWSFRFKDSAGQDWTSWDPWWNGQDARKLVFLRNGKVLQSYPKGCGACVAIHNGIQLFDVFSERTLQVDGTEVPAPRTEMRWRFVSQSLDLPVRPHGAYIRITVGGRDVPTYVVRRSSNGNWGFILESCWGMYASYEMARQVLPSSIFTCRRRTRDEDHLLDDDESDDEYDRAIQRERMKNVRRRIALFEEESTMTQNTSSQWREALLYNVGANVLPESFACEISEFLNSWRNAVIIRR